jgi:flagellar motor switch protein FliM
MSKILSQEEIDALLTSAGGSEQAAGGDAAPPRDPVVPYNFRRPDRVSKEQLRSLHFLHDRFARNSAASLSAYLRTVVDLSVLSVEQFTYSEFLMSLPDPTAYYAIALDSCEGLAGLELNPNIAFTMIDRMLGGSGKNALVNRALTEIEQNVTDSVIKILLENLSDTWAPVARVTFRISGRETRPQMLQVAAPNEVVLLLSFDIRIGEVRGLLNLCIPASTLEASGAQFTQSWHRTHRQPSPDQHSFLLGALRAVPVPLTAQLETELSARELLALRPGDIVSLGCPSADPLWVRVGSTRKFRGRPALVGAHVGLAIDHIEDVRVA